MIGLQKVHLVVYEQKYVKLKFRFILSIFVTFCEHLLNSSFQNTNRECTRKTLNCQLSCGRNCNVLLVPVATKFSKCDLFRFIGEEGEQMLKSLCFDALLTQRKAMVKALFVPTISSRVMV